MKISALPLKPTSDGSETVVILDGGIAKRATVAGLAAGPANAAIARVLDASGVLLVPRLSPLQIPPAIGHPGGMAIVSDPAGEKLLLSSGGKWRGIALDAVYDVPLFNFMGGVMPVGATLTRASAGTFYGANGQLQQATANVARFSYDPVTHALRGLLVEPQRSNLLRNSEDFTTGWGKQATGGNAPTVTADFGGSPGGSLNADRVITNRSEGSDSEIYQGISSTVGTKYAASIFAGASAGVTQNATFALVNGNSLAEAYATVAVVAVPGPFRRFSVVRTATDTFTYLQWGSNSGFASDVSPDVLLWGAQVEAVPAGELQQVTSYIPTTNAAATRAADVLTLNPAPIGLANGTYTLRYGYADGTYQDVVTTIAGPWIAPVQSKPLATIGIA